MARKGKSKDTLIVEGTWDRGMLTDMPRTAMPPGTLRNAIDYLLDRPGMARKRGGTIAYGPPVAASVPSFIDASSYDHDVVPHGDAHVETAQKKFGDASAAFDGTGDFLSSDGGTDFVFGTGDFSIDLWLYKTANPVTTGRIFDMRPLNAKIDVVHKLGEEFNSGTNYVTSGTLAAQNNKLYLCSVVLEGGKTVTSIAGCGLTWVKVAEITQGTSAYTTIFRAMVTSGATSGQVTLSFSGTLSGPAHVSIEEVDGANRGGTNGSAAIVQSNTHANTGSNSNTITLATFANTNNVAFGAEGTNDSSDPTAGTGFSKLYAKGNASSRAIITVDKTGQGNPKANTGNGDSRDWAGVAVEIGIANYPVISLTSTGTVTYTGGGGTLTSSAITSSAWHHIAVTRSSGTVRMFIDGTVLGTTLSESAINYLVGANRPAVGGSGVTEGAEGIAGYIDEIRVSKGIARWTANFTPPAAAYTADSQTSWLIHADVFIAAATALRAVAHADFPNGAQVTATADDSHLYHITPDTTVDIGSVGSARTSPLCKPVLHVSGTSRLVLPANDGTSVPFAYDGSTLATLGGSPPAGRIAGIYKARLLLANSVANPNRLWFSPLDLSGTWDTANAWVDFDHPITGIQAIRNACLIFSSGHTDYMTGSIPPGIQGFDMSAGPLGDIGCSDGRSIGVWQDNVVFANTNGVYLTNGAAFRSLTEPPEFGGNGIGSLWRETLAGYTSNWQIHGGILNDFYIATIRDDADILVDTFMCHLPRRSWWRVSNFDAGMYSSLTGNAQELYYAARDTAQVIAVSGIFTPTAANSVDADSSPVEPSPGDSLLRHRPVPEGVWVHPHDVQHDRRGGEQPADDGGGFAGGGCGGVLCRSGVSAPRHDRHGTQAVHDQQGRSGRDAQVHPGQCFGRNRNPCSRNRRASVRAGGRWRDIETQRTTRCPSRPSTTFTTCRKRRFPNSRPGSSNRG